MISPSQLTLLKELRPVRNHFMRLYTFEHMDCAMLYFKKCLYQALFLNYCTLHRHGGGLQAQLREIAWKLSLRKLSVLVFIEMILFSLKISVTGPTQDCLKASQLTKLMFCTHYFLLNSHINTTLERDLTCLVFPLRNIVCKIKNFYLEFYTRTAINLNFYYQYVVSICRS